MRHRQRGLSLMELMVALAIIGIIAAIAYPNYQDSVRKTRRSDGQAALAAVAQRLERCNTQFGRYNAADCAVPASVPSEEGFYAVTVTRTASTFSLQAVPRGAQVKDTICGTLTQDHRGQQGATGTKPANCW